MNQNSPARTQRKSAVAPPIALPEGHIGPVTLPGSRRQVWWTGRVAIGLRYEPKMGHGPLGQSASWLQTLLTRDDGARTPASN